VFVDWTRDIVDADDPVPLQIAGPEAFAAKMSELGIGDDHLVVAYDDYDHVLAGRMAWALRYHGHDAVRVLDGGWSRWKEEGRATTGERPRLAPASFTAHVRPELRRTADQVVQALGRPDVLLVDARAPEQYAGSLSAARRSGHIPGARNVHYARLIDARTGQFLSRDELTRAFEGAGVDVARLPSEIVVYCNGGVSCTVPLEALRMLGRQDVAVYDGSWNEWGNDETRPIKTGKEP
jgi:thiosulfate/3-mercaptopyruvate sulfurtransferase